MQQLLLTVALEVNGHINRMEADVADLQAEEIQSLTEGMIDDLLKAAGIIEVTREELREK